MNPGDLVSTWSNIKGQSDVWAWDHDGESRWLPAGIACLLLSIEDDMAETEEHGYATICSVLIGDEVLEIHAHNLRMIS